MAALSWFPYVAEEWERRVRDLGLSIADEGALMRLVRGAWTAAEPCSIADTPDDLARLVGAEWRKAIPIFQAQFSPMPEQPSRRRCGWLYEIYNRQMEKHLSYRARGEKGGRPKAQRKPELKAELTAHPSTLLRESSSEALTCAPTEHTGKSQLDDTGLAPADAAPADVAANGGTGDYQDAPRNREAMLRAGRRLDPDAPRLEPTPLAEQAAVIQERADCYRSLLEGAATDWQDEHPDEALALEIEVMASQGLRGRALGFVATQALRHAVVERIRIRLGWPTLDAWNGEAFDEPARAA